jgi:FdrA protein
MIVRGTIKKGAYYDSVSLMLVSKELNRLSGVLDSSVVMGTVENKQLLRSVGLFHQLFDDACESDILIGIKAETDEIAGNAIKEVDRLFREMNKPQGVIVNEKIYSYHDAVKKMEGANLALISVAGRYAAGEAMKAMKEGLHVMIFSDNVSVEEEIELKAYARQHGLLLMGPDCGTAIINGIPLGFANAVNRGNIGIVAASGTGIQEVTTILSNNEAGISQAIGTGGRDIKKEVGGVMFLEALKSLGEDDETKILVLISKPPHQDVLKKISDAIRKIKKPVITVLFGGDPEVLKDSGAIPARTLEEAALIATSLSRGKEPTVLWEILERRKKEIRELAAQCAGIGKGKYLRGLFSGGTLCDEAQLVLKNLIGDVYSNSPLHPDYQLKDAWKSHENCIVDLGDDEFTRGRPHPMIDLSLRNKRILGEAADPDVAVILIDVVIGYGSHPDPASELLPVIEEARKISPSILFVGSVTGTDLDPQNRGKVVRELGKAGMIILPSNASAAELTGLVIKNLSVSGK